MPESDWYRTERNTEGLVKAVIAERDVNELSGEDIWRLLQLTWITTSKGHVTRDHWKKLKVPALAHLFGKKVRASEDLQNSLDHMNLPRPVAEAAAKTTGFVNAYRAYRNSLLGWCQQHEKELRAILDAARKLRSNDQDRLELASEIGQLPPVSTPNEERTMAASSHITPLVACLDPKRKFPIINGEDGVNQRLSSLHLMNSSLDDQVKGFIGLIGQFGLVDAFAVDTMTEDQMTQITQRAQNTHKPSNSIAKGTTLPVFDEAERKAVQDSKTIVYRKRHNKMTNRLQELLPGHKLDEGTSPDCRYDVLVTNYDGNGRDLLIEAKPDADKGSIRIAIGQLLDYRRFLPNQAATDLAVLTISFPSDSYLELMQDLQITALWFVSESCRTLAGDGKIWKALEAQLNAGKN